MSEIEEAGRRVLPEDEHKVDELAGSEFVVVVAVQEYAPSPVVARDMVKEKFRRGWYRLDNDYHLCEAIDAGYDSFAASKYAASWQAGREKEATMSNEPTATFDQWAILEQLGHVRLAGHVTEVELFGSKMGRIDIPTTTGGFTTRYFYGSTVYALTPTTEEIARGVALRNQPEPVHRFELPAPRVATSGLPAEVPPMEHDYDPYNDDDGDGDDDDYDQTSDGVEAVMEALEDSGYVGRPDREDVPY